MDNDFPNDDDGDTLRQLVDNGADLLKPMVIDFQIAMPDEQSAPVLAELAQKLGYRAEVYDSPECSLPWTCECSLTMLATYEDIVGIQAKLAELAKPLGGYPDGWGSFGNGPGN